MRSSCRRRQHGTILATLCLLVMGTALAGCGGLVSEPQPAISTVPQAFGVYLNCGGPASPSRFATYEYDINDDGAIDRFVAMRCPDSKSDQLEVFDGKFLEDRPQRLGGAYAGPLIHLNKQVNLDHGCLMFSGRTLLVGVGAEGQDQSAVKVAWIGHWNPERNRIDMVANTRRLVIPCAAVSSD